MSGRERREERRFGPSQPKKTGPTQKTKQKREERKTILVSGAPSTPKPSTPKPKDTTKPQDLMSDIDQLKQDAVKLQSQVDLTKRQQLELRGTIKEIEATRDELRDKKQSLKDIEETAEKIKKIKEEIKEKHPRGSWYGERPTIDFHELTQTLYMKSKYPSKAEIRKALEEKGLAAKEDFKPKSIGEALTRLAYATAEMIEGGVTEATLGLAYDPKSNERPLALPLQVAGGLATPTALDYAFGAVLAKLGITKKGRKLVNKLKDLIDKGDDIPSGLTPAELRQLEKMYGSAPISTSDLRKLDKKTLKTIQEVAEHYAKHPADYTAGAAYVPPEQLFYDEIIDGLGWDDDIYIDFLKTYGDRLNVDKNFLAGVLLRVSINDAVKVLDATAVEIPEDYKDRPASPGLIPREGIKTVPEMGTGEITEPVQEEEPKTAPLTTPTQTTKTGTPTITTPALDTITEAPPDTPEPLPPTPTIPLSKSEREKRREMNLQFYMGPKAFWEVTYGYPRGEGDSVTVEGRGLVDAMGRAQRAKAPTRYLPNFVDIKLVKGK